MYSISERYFIPSLAVLGAVMGGFLGNKVANIVKELANSSCISGKGNAQINEKKKSQNSYSILGIGLGGVLGSGALITSYIGLGILNTMLNRSVLTK